MKTSLASIAVLTLPLFAQADVTRSDDRLRVFASCVGQLSAQMEYEWIFDGPASEVTQNQRSAMLELVDALMSPDDGRQVLHWRIAAKQAHYALLTRATFNEDPEDAVWAQSLAAARTRDCSALLLS